MVEKEQFFEILKILNDTNKPYYIDGGFGVDILNGKITRWHRDVDVDVDTEDFEYFVDVFKKRGFVLVLDELPIEVEYSNKSYGIVNIHPYDFSEGIRPISNEGGVWQFDNNIFIKKQFEGVEIPCISVEGQLKFHKGYKQRDVDEMDMDILLNLQ